MRDPSRKEDAKNVGIVYGTGAVAALLTLALLLRASPAPVMEVVVEAAPNPVPVALPEIPVEPVVHVAPQVVQISGDNRLFGTVTTFSGDRYTGYIRWDRNEGSWADLLDANKQPDHGQGRVVRVRRERDRAREREERGRERAIEREERARERVERARERDDRGDRESLSGIALRLESRELESYNRIRSLVIDSRGLRNGVMQSFSFSSGSTQSGIRFGHVKSIASLDSRSALFTLKSGEEMVFSGNATDLGSSLRALVVEQLDGTSVELDWDDLDVVEFEAAPEDASPPSSRNYGTMTTHSGLEFTGYVTWDVDEIYSSDVLDGEDRGDDREIPFGSIERIDRDSSMGSMVTLDTGEEVLLRGSDDVDESNNGISVSDPGLGQVKVSWYEFASVRFHEAEAHAGYGQFDGGQAIFGTVTTRDGDEYTGEMVWDCDESFTWEMLNGEQDGVDFHVEFSQIALLRPISSWGTEVTLKDGRTYELRGTNDVDDSNRGILVRLENGDEVEVEWDDLEEVRLQER